MDSEIRAIMAQYMPLENPEAQSHIRNDQSWVQIAACSSIFMWTHLQNAANIFVVNLKITNAPVM